MTSQSVPPIESPWARTTDELLQRLEVDPESGLSLGEAEQRRAVFGPNELRQARPVSVWKILVDQFKSVIVALLGAATLVSALLGEWVEAGAVAVVIVINTVIGFLTEIRALRSMEALRSLGRLETKVRRDGEVHSVPAESLVPGDVVVFEAGDVITADLRILKGSRLEADEAPLTGESLPVEKGPDPLPAETILAERSSLLHKGTAVTKGSGEGIVYATGMDTELGRISELVEESIEPETPLQVQLQELGRRLLWVTLVLAGVIGLVGLWSGRELRETIETAVALAVAAIPEGLPIVATVALARGMKRMAERNVLIERLPAVETLGSVGIILTDKTGTLTASQMALTHLVLDEATVDVDGGFSFDGQDVDPSQSEPLRWALTVGALCNTSSIEGEERVGDPTELALLEGAAKGGLSRPRLLNEMPEVAVEAFDPGVRMMATIHRTDEGYLVAVKGAPDAVLTACDTKLTSQGIVGLDHGDRFVAANDRLAGEGMRVLALAMRRDAGGQVEDPYSGLTLIGLAALLDPPRADVREAIEECKRAGIEVVMITGDQAATATHIARSLGFDQADTAVTGAEIADSGLSTDARVLARTSPEQKLDVIAAFQSAGARVAMIGDGVNDAPALKKADIGVAMGIRGTEVAKEASDVILRDDRFGSIVEAVREGRIVFDNIRRFVVYLLSSNLSEIIVVAVGSVLALPLPLLPLQILYLNLITDVFPALALGTGRGSRDVMRRRPRPPGEGVLTRAHWVDISLYGVMIAAPVLGVLALAYVGLGLPTGEAVTISFLTLAFAQLWHVFNMSDPRSPMISNDVTRNPYVWGAVALSGALLALAMYWPLMADVIEVEVLDGRGWLLVLVASLVPLLAGQALRPLRRRLHRHTRTVFD